MKKILFSTRPYRFLAQEMLALGDFKRGKVEEKTFPDGEHYQRILTNVEDRSVVLVGGTVNDVTTLELYDLASTLVQLGCASLDLVIPYYGYSTMERAVQPGEVVAAKNRARLLSSIPRSQKGNKVYLFDLHSEGIPHYFEDHLRAVHVYCKDLIIEAALQNGGSNFVLASTDAGRAKWVESLAKEIGVNPAFVLKRRVSGSETEVTAINADVAGKTVVLYDDMIRSGSSLIHAANAYQQAGATRIVVITTHAVFVNGAVERLQASGLIEKVICTNTHVASQETWGDFVEVLSIAPLMIKHLKKGGYHK
ncbi:MAG: ribose-phosphate diphosphokinase [Salibacteraceae bacterium]